MTKILVLYYSAFGHVEALAYAAAEGAESAGAVVDVLRVPETLPPEVTLELHYKTKQKAQVAEPQALAQYDGIIFACGAYFGMMPAQMKNFIDQTTPLWLNHGLVGKVGSVMAAGGAQHAGLEAMILSFHTVLLHHGMVLVGLPYQFQQQLNDREMMGNSPYGASTITGVDDRRLPAAEELGGARFQGAHVARIAAKLCSIIS